MTSKEYQSVTELHDAMDAALERILSSLPGIRDEMKKQEFPAVHGGKAHHEAQHTLTEVVAAAKKKKTIEDTLSLSFKVLSIARKETPKKLEEYITNRAISAFWGALGINENDLAEQKSRGGR